MFGETITIVPPLNELQVIFEGIAALFGKQTHNDKPCIVLRAGCKVTCEKAGEHSLYLTLWGPVDNNSTIVDSTMVANKFQLIESLANWLDY